jgi:hypothetical protein
MNVAAVPEWSAASKPETRGAAETPPHMPYLKTAFGIIGSPARCAAPVLALQRLGAIAAFGSLSSLLLVRTGVDQALVLPAMTKLLAGSTTLVGVSQHLTHDGQLTAGSPNHSSGLLLHTLGLPGIGIFASAGERLAKLLLPALAGAVIGVVFRGFGTITIF